MITIVFILDKSCLKKINQFVLRYEKIFAKGDEMRIFLLRHGQSKANMDTEVYEKDGDSRVGLTDTGWEQAIGAGRFLKEYLAKNGEPDPEDMRVWGSPYDRTRQTVSGLLYGAEADWKVRIDAALIEQSFGDYFAFTKEAKNKPPSLLNLEFNKPIERYKDEWAKDKFFARPPRGERPSDVQNRVKDSIDTIWRNIEKGRPDHVVVTHGVSLRVFAMDFMHIDPKYYEEFPNPPNCGIYLIEGKKDGPYSFRQIYDGEKGEAVDIDWGKKLKAGQAVIPPVPDHIREKFENAPIKPAKGQKPA